MRKQRGATLIELLFAIIFLASLLLTGGALYAAWHFISKFW